MKKIISTENIPIKLWTEDIEDGALVQAKNLANLPFAFSHIAIMPDVHPGYGMPIGGVMATEKFIVPNAAGVDIGCGVCAIQTSAEKMDIGTVEDIIVAVRSKIPLGFNRHKDRQPREKMPKLDYEDLPIIKREYDKALTQLGTLGGGNHFIEIQKGDDGYIWLMIHSGSRNLGYTAANYYNKLAKELDKNTPSSWDLAAIPLDSDLGQEYLKTMQYCVEFAFANRRLMMERFIEIFMEHVPPHRNISINDMINIAHNYAEIERHFGREVIVHRKGATKATEGLVGIIPGSQGTSSFVVQGKGNVESFKSCSHGAGRTMGRNEARRRLNLKDEQKRLEGIVHSLRGTRDLDEAAGAYKDITTVMKNQEDLVDILVELQPLGVLKG